METATESLHVADACPATPAGPTDERRRMPGPDIVNPIPTSTPGGAGLLEAPAAVAPLQPEHIFVNALCLRAVRRSGQQIRRRRSAGTRRLAQTVTVTCKGKGRPKGLDGQGASSRPRLRRCRPREVHQEAAAKPPPTITVDPSRSRTRTTPRCTQGPEVEGALDRDPAHPAGVHQGGRLRLSLDPSMRRSACPPMSARTTSRGWLSGSNPQRVRAGAGGHGSRRMLRAHRRGQRRGRVRRGAGGCRRRDRAGGDAGAAKVRIYPLVDEIVALGERGSRRTRPPASALDTWLKLRERESTISSRTARGERLPVRTGRGHPGSSPRARQAR